MQFLHVSIISNRTPSFKKLEVVFSDAKDWLRYCDTCWILYTEDDHKTWYNKLKNLKLEETTILILPVDILQRTGLMPKTCWDWFNKYEEVLNG